MFPILQLNLLTKFISQNINIEHDIIFLFINIGVSKLGLYIGQNKLYILLL